MTTLNQIFSEADDLLKLEPEELAGILIEVAASTMHGDKFAWQSLLQQVHPPAGGGWPRSVEPRVTLAIAEALAWLVREGLVMRDPWQPGEWYRLTRRGQRLTTRVDVDSYRHGGILPADLLQPYLLNKVHYLFLRGDYDTAVFQAFKEVEVAVRVVAGLSEDDYGVSLMRKAFHAENGPLSDKSAVVPEREAELALFAGAIGHAKNPSSHRTVGLEREEAARLVVFASYLLERVHKRMML